MSEEGIVIRQYGDWTKESYDALVAANEARKQWLEKNLCPCCGGLINEDGSHRDY